MCRIALRKVLKRKRPETPSGGVSGSGAKIASWCEQRMWVQGGAFAGGGR
jgi:hypothetical protein